MKINTTCNIYGAKGTVAVYMTCRPRLQGSLRRYFFYNDKHNILSADKELQTIVIVRNI